MSYLVLARKYRPQTFEEIVGQAPVTRTLQNAIKQGKVHHAFLFTGTRGVGKTTTARVLARALCCQATDGPNPTPCGTCQACVTISAGRATDIQEIDGASNNSVNDIRSLRDNVQYQPQLLRYKLYIIDEVHMLSQAAFNALLKTLEEPPAHVKFVFATTESHKIPQTILSRCQRYDFKSVPVAELAAHLNELARRESLIVEDNATRLLARLARGSVRDGLSLFDAVIAYAGTTIKEEDVRLVLGMADAQGFERLALALAERDPKAVFATVSDLVDYGHDLRQFGSDFLEYLRDLVLLASDETLLAALDRPESERRALKTIAAKGHAAEWIAFFDLMVEGQERIARAEQARYLLELTLAKMLQVGRLRSVDELMADVARLLRQAGAPATSAGPEAGSGGAARPRPFEETGALRQAAAPQATSAPAPSPSAVKAAAPAVEAVSRPTSNPFPAYPANWRELVEAVKGESKPLWSSLLKVSPLVFETNRITIECPGDSIAWDQVGEAGARARLQTTFSRLLGRPIELKVERQAGLSAKGQTLEKEHEAKQNARSRRMLSEGKNDPRVLALREVFGGGEVQVLPLSELADDEKESGDGAP